MTSKPNLLVDPAIKNQVLQLKQSAADLSPYFMLMLERLPVIAFAVDRNDNLVFASKHFSQFAGIPDSLEGILNPVELFPLPLRGRVQKLLRQSRKEALNWEISINHKDGSKHTYEMQNFPLGTAQKGIFLTLGARSEKEVSVNNAMRDHHSQIAYMTFHDPLTGLANRSLFYDRMEKSLSRAKRNSANLALMLIDIDRFKNINDSLGQEAGDLYLKQVANILKNVLRDTDTIARLSADEFVVVLENIVDALSIENVANKLLENLSQPVTIQGNEITCTASIGISLFPKDGQTTDKLLRSADLAMYRAKSGGKNRLQFYLKAMTDTAMNYLLLENELRKAIDKDHLVLHYQPQIDLSTNRIVGVEALVRWNHPTRGLISPMEFIPLAEETGLIEPIGEWVLYQACESFSRWRKQGLDLGRIAVNLSARQFRQEYFEKLLENILNKTGLAAEYLELEITETSVMENAGATVNLLHELNSMGLSLAIDDFGTGYSSLSYLKKFPIHKLKVDRSFIKDIDHDDSDAAITKSIIDLGHNMSLQVIAEGVERESQTKWLIEKGCDQVQGFFYSKPLREAELMRLIYDEKRICNDHYCIFLNV